MEKDQENNAKPSLESQVDAAPVSAEKLKQALASHQNGAFEEAAAAYVEIISRQPDNCEALQRYAVLQAQCEKPLDALALIDRAIAAARDNAVGHFYRGNILRDLGRPEEALQSYQQALKINSEYPGALYGCGNAWQDLNRPSEALASYDAALRLNPDLMEVLYNRGKMLQELKRHEEALLSYERVLRLNPDLAEAHCGRGDAFRGLNRPSQALGSYDRALQINPEFGVALYHRGDMLRKLGRVDAALASYKRAFQLYPQFVEAILKHADVLRELKRYEEALADYDLVISIKPDAAEAHNDRGTALFDLQRYEDALAAYESAISLDPHLDWPYINRGNALKALARTEEGGKDAVWMPTSQALVDKMLDVAYVGVDDFLIDLGSGDGRTVIAAARRGARALGIEYNARLVKESTENAALAGLSDKVSFLRQDVFEADFSCATVLTMFLLAEIMLKLRPKILNMKPGTRVVSNSFTFSDWTADETAVVETSSGSKVFFTAHLWIVPAKVEGTWRFEGGEVTLRQNFQVVEGWLTLSGETPSPLIEPKLRGNELSFRCYDNIYSALIDSDVLIGCATSKSITTAWSASRWLQNDEARGEISPT